VITKKTCLILGAGASADYGFPSGKELLFRIVHGLGNHDGPLRQWLRSFDFSDDDLTHFQDELLKSNRLSVDAFLEQRWEFVNIGRHAIAISLIPCEMESELIRKEQERWYEYLWNLMDCRARDFEKNQLAIVTFNYDRSLEYFLFGSARASYGLDEHEAAALVKSIPIIHVYGKLAEPHFLDTSGRAYDPQLHREAIQKSASNINIMFEGDTSGELERANDAINRAERCCFLGFGYHPVNIERLALTSWTSRVPKPVLFGTTYRLGRGEVERIKKYFGRGDINFHGCTILDFLKDSNAFS
jgi:hypothetical protein